MAERPRAWRLVSRPEAPPPGRGTGIRRAGNLVGRGWLLADSASPCQPDFLPPAPDTGIRPPARTTRSPVPSRARGRKAARKRTKGQAEAGTWLYFPRMEKQTCWRLL